MIVFGSVRLCGDRRSLTASVAIVRQHFSQSPSASGLSLALSKATWPWMAVVIFAATYLLAASIYWVVTTLAVNDRARAFKAVSPGMLPPLGISTPCCPLSTSCHPLSTSCHPLSTSCRPLSTSCRRHVRQAVANITTGMVKTASTPATTGPTLERGRSRNARTLLCCTHRRAAWPQSFTFPPTCSENAAAVKVEDWYIKDRE